MGEEGLAKESAFCGTDLKTEFFANIKAICDQPKLGFLIALFAVDVRRFIPLIRIEEKPPAIK